MLTFFKIIFSQNNIIFFKENGWNKTFFWGGGNMWKFPIGILFFLSKLCRVFKRWIKQALYWAFLFFLGDRFPQFNKNLKKIPVWAVLFSKQILQFLHEIDFLFAGIYQIKSWNFFICFCLSIGIEILLMQYNIQKKMKEIQHLFNDPKAYLDHHFADFQKQPGYKHVELNKIDEDLKNREHFFLMLTHQINFWCLRVSKIYYKYCIIYFLDKNRSTNTNLTNLPLLEKRFFFFFWVFRYPDDLSGERHIS